MYIFFPRSKQAVIGFWALECKRTIAMYAVGTTVPAMRSVAYFGTIIHSLQGPNLLVSSHANIHMNALLLYPVSLSRFEKYVYGSL